MEGDGYSVAFLVSVYPVAATLSHQFESSALKRSDGLSGGDSGKPSRHTATSRVIRLTDSG